MRVTSRPVATSWISVPRSSAATASCRPSGLKAIRAAQVRARKAVRRRVRTSQTRTGCGGSPVSAWAAASNVPSGEKASAWESPCIPFSSPAGASVRVSQSVTRPPAPVAASSRPSGLNAIDSALPGERAHARAPAQGARVEQVDRPVDLRQRECVSARADRDPARRVVDRREVRADAEAAVEALVAREVPQQRAPVGPRAEQRPPIGRDVEQPGLAGVPGEALRDRALRDVPGDQPARLVPGHERARVGREAQRADPRRVAGGQRLDRAGGEVQQPHPPVRRAERVPAAVRADRAGRAADRERPQHPRPPRIELPRAVIARAGDVEAVAGGARRRWDPCPSSAGPRSRRWRGRRDRAATAARRGPRPARPASRRGTGRRRTRTDRAWGPRGARSAAGGDR